MAWQCKEYVFNVLAQLSAQNTEFPKSPRRALYTHQNSKGTHHLLTTCVLGMYHIKFPMNKNINDGTHSQCSGTHMDHGQWVSRTHKEVNNFEFLRIVRFQHQKDAWEMRLQFEMCIFICSKIVLWWMLKDFFEDKLTLVQVMVWCCKAASQYLNQCWPRFMPHGVTRG